MKMKPRLLLLILFPVFICVFLFLPAGTFKFWEAWVYSASLLIPMLTTVFYLAKNDPGLLERRLRLKEKEVKQKKVVRFFMIPFFIGYLITGFDHRFNWSEVSTSHVIIANVMVLIGYFWVFLVFRENSYTSRIIEVEKGQKVITTGPYSIVRHPMYLGASIMYLFTPFALGSWWALIVFIFIPVVLIYRIFDEERLLLNEFPGYQEYCRITRFRLIPFIW
jgi:protein-S-isoprenylcysteine O-methyltransferase Ste14